MAMAGPVKPTPLMVNMQNNQDGIFRTYANAQHQQGKENIPEKQLLLKFPITRAILWNRSPIGKAVNISFSGKRQIRMYVSDKTLLLASKHAHSQNGTMQSFLIGDFITDSEEGIILQVDRFDPGRNVQIQTESGSVTRKVPTAVIPGDHTISLTFCHNFRNGLDESDSSDNFVQSFEVLNNRCSKKSVVGVPDMFMSHATFYGQADVNELIVNFKCNVVTFSTQFIAKPINPVPIIPTALAKNLSGPMRLSQVQGNAKFGYLTMDQTRKLLVLLETDPKVESLPLVGLWVSGVAELSHAYVWACCLKFLNADYIKERVLAPPSSFLLVHYPTSKAYPDFYECCVELPDSNETPFALLTCQDQFVINMKPDSCDAVCMDLCVADDASLTVFHESVQQWLHKRYPKQFQGTTENSTPPGAPAASRNPTSQQRNIEDDSMPTPRQLPKPHALTKEMHPATPSVPEPSFLEPREIGSSASKPYNPSVYQGSEVFVEKVTKEQTENGGLMVRESGLGRAKQIRQQGQKDTDTLSGRRESDGFTKILGSMSVRDGGVEKIAYHNGISDRGSNGDAVKRAIDQYSIQRSPDTSPRAFQLESEPKTLVDGKRISFNGSAPKLDQNQDDELDVSFDSILGIREEGRATHEEEIFSDQKQKKEEEKILMQQHERQIKRPTRNEPNPLSLIAAHEQQLFELQEQIEILLEQKRQEDLRNEALRKENERKASQTTTSVQCCFLEKKPEMASVSVNTGESLLLLGPLQKSVDEGKRCSCCCKCGSTKRPSKPRRSRTSDQNTTKRSSPGSTRNSVNHFGDISFSNQSCNLSDLQAVDISTRNVPGNTSSMSMQSFASVLEAVDVPVFDDSQNTEPASPNDLELGESASMIITKQQNQSDNLPTTSGALQDEEDDNEENSDNVEKEFYQQMVAEVKGFLSDQFENIQNEDNKRSADANDSENEEPIEVFSKIDRQKMVENATIQQLKVLGTDQIQDTKTVDDMRILTPLPSNATAHLHPRINYVSMFGSENTDDDDTEVADAIAMKYLTSKQLKDVKCSVQQHRTKTVKFEGILEEGIDIPKRGMNFVSMNFSCNMSIATKRYMQRYNLLDAENNETVPQKGKKMPKATRGNIDSSNILDFNKLKQLPKLL